MGFIICPNCGGKVSTTIFICSHCQYEFEKKVCPDCNEVCNSVCDECPTCGHEFVNKKICPDCNEPCNEDCNECPTCGHEFAKMNQDINNDSISAGENNKNINEGVIAEPKVEEVETKNEETIDVAPLSLADEILDEDDSEIETVEMINEEPLAESKEEDLEETTVLAKNEEPVNQNLNVDKVETTNDEIKNEEQVQEEKIPFVAAASTISHENNINNNVNQNNGYTNNNQYYNNQNMNYNQYNQNNGYTNNNQYYNNQNNYQYGNYYNQPQNNDKIDKSINFKPGQRRIINIVSCFIAFVAAILLVIGSVGDVFKYTDGETISMMYYFGKMNDHLPTEYFGGYMTFDNIVYCVMLVMVVIILIKSIINFSDSFSKEKRINTTGYGGFLSIILLHLFSASMMLYTDLSFGYGSILIIVSMILFMLSALYNEITYRLFSHEKISSTIITVFKYVFISLIIVFLSNIMGQGLVYTGWDPSYKEPFVGVLGYSSGENTGKTAMFATFTQISMIAAAIILASFIGKASGSRKGFGSLIALPIVSIILFIAGIVFVNINYPDLSFSTSFYVYLSVMFTFVIGCIILEGVDKSIRNKKNYNRF